MGGEEEAKREAPCGVYDVRWPIARGCCACACGSAPSCDFERGC